ncbi:hypothetical protein MsAg5_00350 [Methanosarcinaceae archaeon Ag5]|uniref:VWA domain-containing protein n=1 Tax=Methanolapillus africanus TaxID=3028297 RepID=A0AAE4MJC7_9EURY|nr:hypothetical protein [Methanosarcinaceae archaeon Ag5]
MVSFSYPWALVLLIPVIILAGYYFKKAAGRKQKILFGTRGIIAVLLVLAIANPLVFMNVTKTNDHPELVLVSDTTQSMKYFKSGVGQDLYNYFTGTINVQYDTLTGNYTALGEKIIQYADGKNKILIVSDGNSNYGTSLTDAINFSKETNTTVSAVIPDLIQNDLSVEITGDKSIIVGNEQEFGIVVRQAGNANASYNYEIYADGTLIERGSGTLNSTEKTTTFTTRFTKLGAHTLRVSLTSAADSDKINNNYTKSVYVIEKPNVIVVTSEQNASLTQVVGTLYNVTVVTSLSQFTDLDKALSSTKTVVIDNMYIGNITEKEVASLKNYVSEGGGLVVVGGTGSYGYPEGNSYLNSSFEKLLPVVSIPSDWEGTQDVLLFIDVSDSGNSYAANNETILSNIKKTAINIIDNDYFKEANMTYLTIGDPTRDIDGEFYYVGNPKEANALKLQIENLKTGDGETDLLDSFEDAAVVLENRSGQPLIIVMTDGNIVGRHSYSEILAAENKMKDYGATIVYINIYTGGSTRPDQFKDKSGTPYAEDLADDYGKNGVYVSSPKGLPVDPNFEEMFGASSSNNTNRTESGLYVSNPKHFIVQGLDLSNTSVSGYNSVTPKAGSDKLVIASDGAPVLTVWRYGLGRVASVTTDNGVGRGNYWAPDLYTSPGSKLISSTINWAMGDPNRESGIVIDAPDTSVGLPTTLRVNMYDQGIPVLTLDGKKLVLTMESENVYTSELLFNQSGTYNISGYPIAVNYPIEYQEIGVNPDFRKLIESTGGNIYTANEAKAFFIKSVSDDTTYKVKEVVGLNVYLLLLALVIFLAEVVYRRVREIKELRRLHEEYETRAASGEKIPPTYSKLHGWSYMDPEEEEKTETSGLAGLTGKLSGLKSKVKLKK